MNLRTPYFQTPDVGIETIILGEYHRSCGTQRGAPVQVRADDERMDEDQHARVLIVGCRRLGTGPIGEGVLWPCNSHHWKRCPKCGVGVGGLACAHVFRGCFLTWWRSSRSRCQALRTYTPLRSRRYARGLFTARPQQTDV